MAHRDQRSGHGRHGHGLRQEDVRLRLRLLRPDPSGSCRLQAVIPLGSAPEVLAAAA